MAAEVTQKVEEHTKPIQEFITKVNNDWVPNMAAALAYNLLTAFFPIAIALLSILGLFLGSLGTKAQDNLLLSIKQVFPSSISSQDIIRTIMHQLPDASRVLGVIAILFAIFAGSRLFVLIENCFDIIYHLRPRTFIRQNLVAIGMLLLFAVLIPIMIFTSSIPVLILSVLQNTFVELLPGSGYLFSFISILGSLLVSFILFLAIYMIMPNQHIYFKNSWLGALIAAIALQIYLSLFPLYVSRFLSGYVGQVGFALILIIFFYYFALILLLGAEVNAFFSEKVLPAAVDLATLVHGATSHNLDQPDTHHG